MRMHVTIGTQDVDTVRRALAPVVDAEPSIETVAGNTEMARLVYDTVSDAGAFSRNLIALYKSVTIFAFGFM